MITLTIKKDNKEYYISQREDGSLWLSNQDAEGMEISWESLDKYFKENL